jgi:hypothetical protein
MTVRIIAIFIVLVIFPDYAFAQLQRPSITVIRRPGSFIIRSKPTKEQKRRLQPNPQDVAKYEQFLAQPRTGIFRLMPDIGCTENVNVIRADAVCLNFIPESSYYSFREKEHTVEMLADIRLRNGFLISDGILSQSILVHLGDVELERVAPTSEGLEFLSEFLPNPLGFEAQKQYVQMMRGVKIGRYEYKKALPMIENATYALRVVAYRGNIFRSFRGYRFDVLDGDKRIDLTLAFRVIRKEQDDGSVTLLWKEIERRESPRIVFPKRKKNK